MSEASLKCSRGGTMDNITVEYDTGSAGGIFYLSPVRELTQNGAVEVRGKGKTEYVSGGVPYIFSLRGETTDGAKTVEAVLDMRPPKITYTKSGSTILFKLYNTRHFYLSSGIGRIDAAENAQVNSEGEDFYFDVKYVLPANFLAANGIIKAICLPVVKKGKASAPYYIEIKV